MNGELAESHCTDDPNVSILDSEDVVTVKAPGQLSCGNTGSYNECNYLVLDVKLNYSFVKYNFAL